MVKIMKLVLKGWCFLLMCFQAKVVLGQGKARTRTDFLDLLNDIPINRVPPNLDTPDPAVIECDLYINSVDSINEADMDFTVDLGIHLSWQNHELIQNIKRVKYDFDYLDFDATNMKKVWVPDLYFPNEKQAKVHDILMPNMMLRLYKDSTISFLLRTAVTLSCRMDLRKYPFDKQICSIMLESFGYTSEKLHLIWDQSLDNPVETNNIKELRQFRMQDVKFSNFTRTHNITGNHSCLQADFHLVRNIGYYVVQMYIPSLLIVMLSWLSFWLNANSIPGRVTLGVLSVLTISTQSSGVNASLPRVSYTKAIDIWMITCLVFVFMALIEFAVVNVLSRKHPGRRFSLINFFLVQKEGQQDDKEETTVDQEGRVNLEQSGSTSQSQASTPRAIPKNKIVMCSAYLDIASRFMFPIAFGIFNLVYWIYYLNVTDLLF